jgi:hypothetical protein
MDLTKAIEAACGAEFGMFWPYFAAEAKADERGKMERGLEAAAPLIAAQALADFAEHMARNNADMWMNDPVFSMAIKAARQVGLAYGAGQDPYARADALSPLTERAEETW